MKKYSYSILLLIFLILTTCIIVFRKEEKFAFKIPLRQGAYASEREWSDTKAAIENLIANLKANPKDEKVKIALGNAYINEGRVSGNHSYYDKAALFLFDEILKEDPSNFEALVGKATVLLSQHHFDEALSAGLDAERYSVHSSTVYGILTDAYLEKGDYVKAVEMADKMVSLRPDLRSYSRVSYLREIFGDYPGAIEAMKMAVEAGYPGMEQTEWCRVQLGHLYENTGQFKFADNCYSESIGFRPSFAFSYAGKARLAKREGKFNEAVKYIQQAQLLQNDFSFQQELTEIYRLKGEQKLASESADITINLLAGIDGSESESVHGHYADKELAYAYLDSYDYLDAYRHAVIEYNRRPDNIEINQAMAWVNYKLGHYAKANEYINKALRTNSRNPVLNYQAGLIKIKCGETAQGNKLCSTAKSSGQYISPLLR